MTRFPRILFRIPIFWLFSGPPIFRGSTGRSAYASLEGNLDVWNLLRLGWWLAFGLLMLVDLYRLRRGLEGVLRKHGWLIGSVLLWLLSLYVSALESPSSLFTLVNAGMITILVVGALDLAVKLSAGVLNVEAVLKILYRFSVFLLLLVTLFLLVSPGFVVDSTTRFAWRVLGGGVADSALLAITVIFLSLYFGLKARGLRKLGYGGAIAWAFVLLLLAQTRTEFVILVVGALLFLGLWWSWSQTRSRLLVVSVFFLTGGTVAALALGLSFAGQEGFWQTAQAFIVRDPNTLSSWSGRDGISTVLFDAVLQKPLGLGYAAGPRVVLLSSSRELWAYGVIAERIGNAHNMYLEILGGAGIAGFLLWLVILSRLARLMWRADTPVTIPVRIFFVMVLLNGLTGSEGALPFNQVSAMLWITAAVAVAESKSYEYSARSQPLPASWRRRPSL